MPTMIASYHEPEDKDADKDGEREGQHGVENNEHDGEKGETMANPTFIDFHY